MILISNAVHDHHHDLSLRGYKGRKLNENIECEIMHVIVEEARESYREEIVKILKSNTVEDQENNVDVILSLINSDKGQSLNSSAEKRQRTGV